MDELHYIQTIRYDATIQFMTTSTQSTRQLPMIYAEQTN